MRRISLLLSGVPIGALLAVLGSLTWVNAVARGHRFPAADVPASPVALVLGAQVFTDGTPSPFLAARLELARQLYVAGRVGHLLLSGDGAAPKYDEPAAMQRFLLDRGVPSAALTTDPYGLDTYDSCWRARWVYGHQRLTVVTQSYHLPRAVATARALGVDAVGVGDESVRPLHRSWRTGVARELLACVKTVRDLTLRRRPAGGEPR
ncbi:MAG: SanA/YdcF family protein [Propionibacteriaceae bacterium]